MAINFTTVWDSDYWMQSNGMYCGFNMPKALTDAELAQGLPPYEKRKFYLADEYPACPKNWVPSEGRKTSYFVPVKEGHGMWLDFNKNNEHKYQVAIVISVQGVNPITGMPCVDAGLEQYIDTCPKHDVKFGPNRYCEKCGYKWPKQNYICTTATPNGNLWLDGFRTAEGVVRQYILTNEKIRGVAANILKEERVFAVGISFFLSVNPKPVIQQTSFLRGGNTLGGLYGSSSCSSSTKCSKSSSSSKIRYKGGGSSVSTNVYSPDLVSGHYNRNAFITHDSMEDNVTLSNISDMADTTYTATTPASAGAASSDDDYYGSKGVQVVNSTGGATRISRRGAVPDYITEKQLASVQSVNVKKLEVGAGANIKQQVWDDPEPLEFWRKEPEAVICINYCQEAEAEKIIKAGRISLEGHKESFLKDIPVGNKKEKEMA